MALDLQPYVVAYHRHSVGKSVNPAHVDFISAFKADAALLAHANEELQRLDALNAHTAGNLANRDYDQRLRHVALGEMLAKYNGQVTSE